MKQRKFRKVIKADKDFFFNCWFYGLASISLPLLLLLETPLTFSAIVFNAFLDGICVTVFVHSIIKYSSSRKVYYKEIK